MSPLSRDGEPSEQNLTVLAATILHGRKRASHVLGMSESNVQHHVSALLARLDVDSRWDAAAKLGWLHVPEDYQMRVADPGGTTAHAGSGGSVGALSPPLHVRCPHGFLHRGWCYECPR
jgi:hypothetical protein